MHLFTPHPVLRTTLSLQERDSPKTFSDTTVTGTHTSQICRLYSKNAYEFVLNRRSIRLIDVHMDVFLE